MTNLATEHETMITNMRLYAGRKAQLEEQRGRAKAYLQQVKDDIEEDLASLEAHLDSLKESMTIFVREHNAGKRFRVPGLGTAYLQKRGVVNIADEDKFQSALNDTEREDIYEHRFVLSRARRIAERRIKEHGEVLPGVQYETSETLSIRLS